MRINQNVMAFNAYRNLSTTQGQMGKSLEKLSSGFRINRAADDAAGLSISENLRSEIGGLKQATRNAQDGVSIVQTAEGALTESHAMLQRMRDLSVQAANTGANDSEARGAIQAEINELVQEIDRIAEQTSFGGVALLDGNYGGDPATPASATLGEVDGTDIDFSGTSLEFSISVDGGAAEDVTLSGDYSDTDELLTALNGAVSGATFSLDGDDLVVTSDTAGDTSSVEITTVSGAAGSGVETADVAGAAGSGSGAVFQVGANQGDTIEVSIANMSSDVLGVDALDVDADAGAAITALDGAIQTVSEQRSELGAVQNRFEHTIANLQVSTENLQASESRIRDTDMALEMTEFTRHQILQQAGTAMLSQANMVPQSVLGLLG